MRKRIRHPHPVLRAIRLVVGVLLFVGGVIGLLIPVVPQWPFIIPGLMLLAPESRYARRLIVWLRTRLKLRRRRKARAEAPPGTGS